MPDVSNMQQMEKVIEIQFAKTLEIVAQKVQAKLIQITGSQWYQANTSEFYERTWQFIQSISQSKVKKVGNNFEVEIFFDTDKIHSIEGQPGEFNAHMSLDGSTSWKGTPIPELIPIFIEKGQTSKVHPYEGIHMIEQTREWTRENIARMVLQEFKSAGFNVQVL